jgi:hypothetical protein
MPTNREHLARLAELADANADEIARVAADLDATRLLWRPSPERWGVADCMEHLVSTGAAYYPKMRAAVEAATHDPARDDARWAPSWLGRFLLGAVGPNGRAVRAPAALIPPPARPDAPARLLAQQDELRALIAEAHGADLRAVRIPSPISRLLSLRLGEALEMLLLHQRRHLNQAWRVRRASNFPIVRSARPTPPTPSELSV